MTCVRRLSPSGYYGEGDGLELGDGLLLVLGDGLVDVGVGLAWGDT